MRKLFNLFIILFYFQSFSAQTLYDEYESFFSYGEKLYDTDIKNVIRSNYKDIFKYDTIEVEKYKDSASILSKIDKITIDFYENIDLIKIINRLKIFPNLKFIKFKNSSLFSNGIKKIPFPNNIVQHQNLEMIFFEYYNDWDYESVFLKLTELSRLKKIGFRGFKEEILTTKNFEKLKTIQGIFFSGQNGPTLPNKFEKLNSLLISTSKYKNIEKEFKKLKNYKELDNLTLAYLKINDTVANAFKNFKSLKKLNLANSKIKKPEKLFRILGTNHKLTELKLSNNKLSSIPKSIKYLKKLQTFYSSNNLTTKTLPKEFYGLKNLKSIEIQGSGIKQISSFRQQKKLINLKLNYNLISKLPESIGNLRNLKLLLLNNNYIDKLPNDIYKLSNLKELKANNNNLHSLPTNFEKLNNLKLLNLNKNYLKELPNNFGDLANLEKLNLEHNYISKLPESIGKLSKLKELNITANEIAIIPNTIINLKNLELLKANSNLIKELPKNFGKLTSLKRLELSHNNIKRLPENFGDLSNLKSLYLHNRRNFAYDFQKYNHLTGKFEKDSVRGRKARKKNEIESLPLSFTKLKKLKFIDFANNTINIKNIFNILINSEFENYYLSVANTKINELPTNNWNKIKAKTLDLSCNSIQKLPKNIIASKYLSKLDLKNNKNGLDTYRKNKEEIRILLEQRGIITEKELEKTNEMVIAYSNIANQISCSSSSNKATSFMKYANRAISINEKLALDKLFNDSLIEFLYKTKDYKRAIKYADIAIKSDTSSNLRFLNSIIPNYRYKAKSQLAIHDTIGAIETYKSLAKNFDKQTWSTVGILATSINKKELSKYSFNEIFHYYKTHLEKKPKDWGYHLSLLEVYIIANEKEKSYQFIDKLENMKVDKNYKVLIDYFKLVLSIVYSDNSSFYKQFNLFKTENKLEKENFRTWSFDLFLLWNKTNKLSNKQKQNIYTLTEYLAKNK